MLSKWVYLDWSYHGKRETLFAQGKSILPNCIDFGLCRKDKRFFVIDTVVPTPVALNRNISSPQKSEIFFLL